MVYKNDDFPKVFYKKNRGPISKSFKTIGTFFSLFHIFVKSLFILKNLLPLGLAGILFRFFFCVVLMYLVRTSSTDSTWSSSIVGWKLWSLKTWWIRSTELGNDIEQGLHFTESRKKVSRMVGLSMDLRR